MIVLEFPVGIPDKVAKTILQAAKILFNSKREGFSVTWRDEKRLEIRQSETKVFITRDPDYESS